MISLIFIVSPVSAWQLERPGSYLALNERDENATTNNFGTVGIGVNVVSYYENEQRPPTNGNDGVKLYIAATANTRKRLEYYWRDRGYYSWVEDASLPNQLLLTDEEVVAVSLYPFKVRFWGGPCSAEYSTIWLSSNGWLSFIDPEHVSTPLPNPYYGRTIPDSEGLDNFVAPLWKDLKPNAQGYIRINYGWITYYPGYGANRLFFVITWNAANAYGVPQIFQVFLERAPPYLPFDMAYTNSRILFQYKTVSPMDFAVVGIEDQGGWRGASYECWYLHNEMMIDFIDSGMYTCISYLVIRLEESDPYASTDIIEDSDWIRGYNVYLNQALPPRDPTARYATAVGGAATTLLSALDIAFGIPRWVSGCGLILDCGLVLYDLYTLAAEEQSPAEPLEITNTFISAQGYEPTYSICPVDASLCATAYWILNDNQNNLPHSLKVWAELWWTEFDYYGIPTQYGVVKTFVELKLARDTNDIRANADRITSGIYKRLYIGAYDQSDWYKVNVNQGHTISVAVDRTVGYTDVYLAIYDPQGNFRKGTAYHSSNVYVNYRADVTGDWFIHVTPYDIYYGLYRLSLNVLHDDGEGCPTLLVWNGTHFLKEGVLNIHSEPDRDTIVQHRLKTNPARQNFIYTLKLAEIAYGYNFSHSYIDRVKLYAIDDKGKKHECYLMYANHSTQGNVLPQLWFSDDIRIETFKDEEIDLKFLAPIFARNIASFIFEIEGHNPYKT